MAHLEAVLEESVTGPLLDRQPSRFWAAVYLAAALAGIALGLAPLLLFLARWRPCVVLCWPG